MNAPVSIAESRIRPIRSVSNRGTARWVRLVRATDRLTASSVGRQTTAGAPPDAGNITVEVDSGAEQRNTAGRTVLPGMRTWIRHRVCGIDQSCSSICNLSGG